MSISIAKWPYHADDEIAAVTQVLQSGCTNYWTGTHGRDFEQEYAKSIGVPYAVAMMNGTVALEAALHALNIGPGDEVITTCRTFIASASCIVMRGAIPVLADVDPDSQNITVETIQPLITNKTKAIIVVHLAGWPCDMPAIMTLAQQYGLAVIEDCAQAHGAEINGRQVGAWGDIAAFSFCQDKIMTTGGEGGMITTHRQDLWEKIWSYKDHGKSYDAMFHRKHAPGFRWVHESFGTNWRMTETQAVLGRLQLKKLPQWLALRARNAAIFTEVFSSIPALRITIPPPHIKHAYYKYYAFLRLDLLKPEWNRESVMQALEQAHVPCFAGSCSEIYHEEAFIRAKLQPKSRLPIAKQLGETSLMFLIHPTLTVESVYHMALTTKKILQEASMVTVTSMTL